MLANCSYKAVWLFIVCINICNVYSFDIYIVMVDLTTNVLLDQLFKWINQNCKTGLNYLFTNVNIWLTHWLDTEEMNDLNFYSHKTPPLLLLHGKWHPVDYYCIVMQLKVFAKALLTFCSRSVLQGCHMRVTQWASPRQVHWPEQACPTTTHPAYMST